MNLLLYFIEENELQQLNHLVQNPKIEARFIKQRGFIYLSLGKYMILAVSTFLKTILQGVLKTFLCICFL